MIANNETMKRRLVLSYHPLKFVDDQIKSSDPDSKAWPRGQALLYQEDVV